MKRRKILRLTSLVAMFSLLMSMLCVSTTYAAGTETLPKGEYSIGSFTFTDTNTTPAKTMPSGAKKLKFTIAFRKAAGDRGIGQVKLTVKIKDSKGNVVSSNTVRDTASSECGSFKRVSYLYTNEISVKGGGKYKVFFDASSVDPSKSNGHYRSIQVLSFVSIVR